MVHVILGDHFFLSAKQNKKNLQVLHQSMELQYDLLCNVLCLCARHRRAVFQRFTPNQHHFAHEPPSYECEDEITLKYNLCNYPI